MKKLILVCCAAALTFSAYSRPDKESSLSEIMPQIDGKIHYQGIIQVNNTSTHKLMVNARQFISSQFGISNSTIQMQDESQGLIIAKCRMKKVVSNSDVPFTIKIQIKDGQYRYDVYDVSIMQEAINFGKVSKPTYECPINEYFGNTISKSDQKKVVGIHDKIQGIIASLNDNMKKKEIW